MSKLFLLITKSISTTTEKMVIFFFFVKVTMLMGSDFIQINVMKVKELKIMELW